MKEVGFTSGVKEIGEFMAVQSGESEEEEVTGEGIGESEMNVGLPVI